MKPQEVVRSVFLLRKSTRRKKAILSNQMSIMMRMSTCPTRTVGYNFKQSLLIELANRFVIHLVFHLVFHTP